MSTVAVEKRPIDVDDIETSSLGDGRVKWYYTPVDKETMRKLMERSDWHGFKQAGLHLGLLVLTGSAAFYAWRQQAWAWMVVLTYMHCTFYGFMGAGAAGHELIHRTVFKTRFWNDFFLWVSTLLGWANHVFQRTSHTKHHQVTVHDEFDMEVILPAKWHWRMWFFMFGINFWLLSNSLKMNLRFCFGWLGTPWEKRLFPESNPKLRQELFNCSRIVLLTHLVLASVFIYYQLWIMFFLVTLAPFTAGWLQFLTGYPQHAGLQPNVPDYRRCCRTMILHPFVSFLYWQMNYHIEHHMFAAVPFWRLRELAHKVVAHDYPPPSRGLWATWKEVLPALRRQQKDPNYFIVPGIAREIPMSTATVEPKPVDANDIETSSQGDGRVKWYYTPVDKETMRQLMERSDWHGFKQVGLHLGLLLLTGSAAFYAWRQQAWVWMVVLTYVHGTFYGFIGGGVAGHELCHRTVFKSRFWNDFFLWISTILGWGNHVFFRTSHTKHHQVTVHNDIDMEVLLPAKLNWHAWVYAFTINLWAIGMTAKMGWRFWLGRLGTEWEKRIFPESNPKLRRQLFNCTRIVWLTHLALAAVFIYYKLWIMFFLVTLAPYSASWLMMLCGFPQHAGLQPNVADYRLCCRTVILNPFFSFLYWQMNYHAEHHMFAAVPFWRLRDLRKVVEYDFPPASRGLWATWKEMLPVLRRQKDDPNYCFVPQLPAKAH